MYKLVRGEIHDTSFPILDYGMKDTKHIKTKDKDSRMVYFIDGKYYTHHYKALVSNVEGKNYEAFTTDKLSRKELEAINILKSQLRINEIKYYSVRISRREYLSNINLAEYQNFNEIPPSGMVQYILTSLVEFDDSLIIKE